MALPTDLAYILPAGTVKLQRRAGEHHVTIAAVGGLTPPLLFDTGSATKLAASPVTWCTVKPNIKRCDDCGWRMEYDETARMYRNTRPGLRCDKCRFRQCTSCHLHYQFMYGPYTDFFEFVTLKFGTSCSKCIGMSPEEIRKALHLITEPLP